MEDGKIELLSGGANSFRKGGRIDATFVGSDGTNVILTTTIERVNGSLPITALSKTDQAYVQSFKQARLLDNAISNAKEKQPTPITGDYAKRINTFAQKYHMTVENVMRWDYVMNASGLDLAKLGSFYTNLARSRDKALGHPVEGRTLRQNRRRLVEGEAMPLQDPVLTAEEKGMVKALKMLDAEGEL